jgi:hypothetical protein
MAKLNPKNKLRNSGSQDFSGMLGGILTGDGLQSQAIKLLSKPEVINEKAIWDKAIEVELSLLRHPSKLKPAGERLPI